MKIADDIFQMRPQHWNGNWGFFFAFGVTGQMETLLGEKKGGDKSVKASGRPETPALISLHHPEETQAICNRGKMLKILALVLRGTAVETQLQSV